MLMLPPTAMPPTVRMHVVPHPPTGATGKRRSPPDALPLVHARRPGRLAWLTRRRELEPQPESR